MTVTNRDRIQLLFDDVITSGTIDIQNSGVVPNGEKWQISRILFTSELLAGCQIDWGDSGGGWERVTSAFTKGSAFNATVDESFTGNGVKKFRFIRKNFDGSSSSQIIIIAEGFKRIGDK